MRFSETKKLAAPNGGCPSCSDADSNRLVLPSAALDSGCHLKHQTTWSASPPQGCRVLFFLDAS